MITYILLWWVVGIISFFVGSYIHNDAILVEDIPLLLFISFFGGPIVFIIAVSIFLKDYFSNLPADFKNKEILKRRKP